MAKQKQTSPAGKPAGGKTPRKRSPRKSPPRNRRGLARAIFAKHDAVTVGQELLESESATVKAKVWETLVSYAFGELKDGAAPPKHLQIIWDIPGPAREKR